MKKTKEKLNDNFNLICILLGVVVLISIITMGAIIQLQNVNAVLESNHVVPKGYQGVYYGLNQSSIVIVLDGRDPQNRQLAANVNNYLRTIK